MPYNCEMLLTHYTHKCNRPAIEGGGRILSALSLMEQHGRMDLARERRKCCEQIAPGVILRDQQPLRPRIVLSDGASFADFVKYLNGHVFFWPDSSAGKRRREAFRAKKYQHPHHIGLRCDLQSLRDANPGVRILFSPFNSGSTPRSPRKSPRSLRLFQPLKSRGGRPLAEVVVRGVVRLPDNTQIECEDGQWHPFFR